MQSAILWSKVLVEGDAHPGTCGLVAKSTIPYVNLVYFYKLCTSSAQYCLQQDYVPHSRTTADLKSLSR